MDDCAQDRLGHDEDLRTQVGPKGVSVRDLAVSDIVRQCRGRTV